MLFYVGLHQPSNAAHFPRSFISINRIRERRSSFPAAAWIMDSGAFTEISTHGSYRHGPEEYASHVNRWHAQSGTLEAAVSQDFMCEPFILGITGLTVEEHQRLTIERYDAIRAAVVPECYVMPVLQGFAAGAYVSHLRQYGARLQEGAWVGVGSVCKRNGSPRAIEEVLLAIHAERPDLRLHGFGLKKTALTSGVVWQLLHSADSMAWSYAARREGRNQNDYREAERYVRHVQSQPLQYGFILPQPQRIPCE